MGSGYWFKCNNCRKRYTVQLGIGYLYPKVYRETVEAITNGDYGKKWQNLYSGTQGAVVDASQKLFICDNCNNWENAKDLSIYDPGNTQQDTDQIVMPHELQQHYHLVKEHTQTCSKCGAPMRKVPDDNIPSVLPCPKCGSANTEEPKLMMWD